MMSTDLEKVELYISCRKLKNMDLFSKSDPQVRLYTMDNGKWSLLGSTEMIKDNLNPNFSKSFSLDFIFEVQQHVKFEVIDVDGPNSFDYIGAFETTLGKIMGAKKQTVIGDVKDQAGKHTGKIIVRGEKQGASQNIICWSWQGIKLMNTDGWFDKSDPFLRFFKKRDDGEWLQVHETEVIMDNLNPIWKTFEIKEDRLCGGDALRPIRVECWDWEKSGKNQYIGDCEISIEQIRKGSREFDLHNPKKKKKTGTLKVSNFSVIERPTFLQYIRGGEQLNVIVAIDFTGSNGHPSRPESLHARNLNGQMNQYQKAINAVCQILLNYDYDQQVPVYGFGGKPHFPTMASNLVSHCFPCSGNPGQTEVQGLEGILNIYDFALNNVELSGPTYFAPLLIETLKLCELQKMQESCVYTILLILTDGEIHDMDQTVDAICGASHLPLSIIIVGVGNADFTKMEILDGDDGLYGSKGQKAQRDLVQFVPFRGFNGDMTQLAQRVLAEVPDQLVEYMRLVGRKPKPPITVDMEKIGLNSMATLSGPISLTEILPPTTEIHFEQSPDPANNYVPVNQNQNYLTQNPFLMNAGNYLVQNIMGLGSPSMQHSQNTGAYMSPQNQMGFSPQQQNNYGQGGYVSPQQNNNYAKSPSMQQSNNFGPGGYTQPTQIQPTWMSQQGHVTLESFGMAQSTQMSHNPSNNQNGGYPSNNYPKY